MNTISRTIGFCSVMLVCGAFIVLGGSHSQAVESWQLARMFGGNCNCEYNTGTCPTTQAEADTACANAANANHTCWSCATASYNDPCISGENENYDVLAHKLCGNKKTAACAFDGAIWKCSPLQSAGVKCSTNVLQGC